MTAECVPDPPLPDALPAEKQAVIRRLVDALAQAPGVAAVVLGGSYASGGARPGSDVDLGIYYHPAAPFAVADIAAIAASVAVAPPTVTDFYAWGAWVNGGAWVQTAAGKVDLLYRNLEQVAETIAAASQGSVQHDYPQQPPYGFYSVIYLAETDICLPLFDPGGAVAALKARVRDYPEALRTRIVNDGLWSAEFSLLHAGSFAAAGDVYTTAGCLTRIATNLTQVLFALNRRYFLSDKRALAEISAFPLCPEGYTRQVSAILAAPGSDADTLAQTVAAMTALWRQAVALTGDSYRPRFVLP